tara:strand:- start:3004 stop:3150 length:147 start_codon:yes stop_codon:yes gene_type:complete
MENYNNQKKIEILNNIERLKQALREKTISVNDYSTLYLAYSQQLKKLG